MYFCGDEFNELELVGWSVVFPGVFSFFAVPPIKTIFLLEIERIKICEKGR